MSRLGFGFHSKAPAGAEAPSGLGGIDGTAEAVPLHGGAGISVSRANLKVERVDGFLRPET